MSTPQSDIPTGLLLNPAITTLVTEPHRVTTLETAENGRSLALRAALRTLTVEDNPTTTSVHHRTTTLLLDG
jgi:hypothetical protein